MRDSRPLGDPALLWAHSLLKEASSESQRGTKVMAFASKSPVDSINIILAWNILGGSLDA